TDNEKTMNRVDEKGKLFTERVHKARVEVRIITLQGEVHGFLHLMPDQRVRDLLNNTAEQFLAVTDATLRGQGGLESQHIDLRALNKQCLVSAIPIDEDKWDRPQDDECN